MYSPSVAQSLTNTYALVNGSSVSYTPRYASGQSKIIFEYSLLAYADPSAADTNDEWPDYGIVHYVPQKNGIDQSGWKKTESITYDQPRVLNFICALDSWGTIPATLRWMARRYSASYPVDLFKIAYLDGTTSTAEAPAILRIHEMKT